jgi:gliding motility-associated-like protein
MSVAGTIKHSLYKRIFVCLLLLFSIASHAQEICDNGVDDNSNGLVDLNDTTASCTCTPQAPSLIPNPSFEQKNCCPSSFSQMNCAQQWIQASSATADYMNACGFIFPAANAAGLVPFPDGNAAAGFISSIGYQEYIGSCLSAPMLKDSTYSFQLSIASTPINNQGGVCNGGVINYPASNIVIYGSENCSNMPFAGIGCPPAQQWTVLDSASYTPVNSWGTISFTFTPSSNINAIILGSPCNLPNGYQSDSSSNYCYPYFYIDNLQLNKTELSNTISQNGSWCNHDLELVGGNVPGATYQWYKEGVALVGQTSLTLDISGNSLPIGNYSLATKVGNNCTYTSVSVVKFNNPPSIMATGSYCDYDPAAFLTANIAGGIWGGPGITDSLNGMFDPNIAGPGNHQVYYTLPGGGDCPRSDTATIVVNAPPAASAGPDTTICSQQTITIGDPPVAGYLYSWNPATDLSNAFASSPTVSITNNTGGPATVNYSLIVTDASTGCQSLDQLVITVRPVPAINPAGPFCRTDPGGMLTASITGGTWSGTGIINSNFGTFSPSSANIGNNLVTYSVNGACGGGDTAIIVVTNPPPVNAGSNVVYCSGDSATIGAAPINGYTYSWQPVNGLSSATVSNPVVSAVNNTSSPVSNNYILTITFSGCQAKDTVGVTVNPQPSLEITNPPAICSPQTADLTAPSITTGTSGGGTLSYWLDSLATNALSSPGSVGTAGTYYIKATATGGCSDIQPVVVVAGLSTSADAGSDITLCTGDTGTIGSAAVPGNTYSWVPATGLSSSSVSNPSVAHTNPGPSPLVITYTVTTSAGGCSAIDSVTVTVNPLATADAGADQTLCQGMDVTLAGVVTGVPGGTWSGGTGTFLPSATTVNAQYTPTAAEVNAGSVTLILTSDDPAGTCVADADTVIITIIPGATANAGADDTICAGNTVSLNALYGGTATTGTWSGGGGTYAPANTSDTAVYTPTATEIETGSVTLIFTTDDPAGSCPAATDTLVIDINQAPVADAGTSVTVCGGAPISLNGTIAGSATMGYWSGGTGTFSPDNTALNATYTPGPGEEFVDSIVLTLTTDNLIGFPCATASDEVIFDIYHMPLVNFSVDDSAGCPELCVNFADLMAGSGVIIASRTWDFGDGSPVSNAAAPSHCYSQTGQYDVTLTVTSENGCSGTLVIPQLIEVYPVPNADFDYSPNPAMATSSLVTLHNLSSPDVSYWFWSFGDGDTLTSYVPDTTHQYPSDSGGTFYTTLIVQNIFGCADTTMHPVVIYPEFGFFIPNAFTPDNDGLNDVFLGKGVGIESYELMIFDRWGNLVFYSDELDKGWDGKVNHGTTVAQQDTYVWKVKLTDVFRKKYNYIGIVSLIR